MCSFREALNDLKMIVLWLVWSVFAIFVFIGIFEVPDILNLFALAGCVVHYLSRYEKI